MEKTLVLVKPDGVQRGLIGEVIRRFENRGLRLAAAKFMWVTPQLAAEHYAVHQGKPFYDALIRFITSAPVMAMVWTGPEAITAVRQTIGKTKATEADPGTIRHDFALTTRYNICHASDSIESAQAEIALWFKADELVDWERISEDWIYE
ncbi:MAG: nucleoside-diphosphate kinase [Anaerolineaceae bacterium]|nr:nucleoside-diphosphate kinase [Anaerolineaceae bacterium]